MSNRLYVGNLPYTITQNDLQQIFSEYGTVVSTQIISDRETGRSRGFGFVERHHRRMRCIVSTGTTPSPRRQRCPELTPS